MVRVEVRFDLNGSRRLLYQQSDLLVYSYLAIYFAMAVESELSIIARLLGRYERRKIT